MTTLFFDFKALTRTESAPPCYLPPTHPNNQRQNVASKPPVVSGSVRAMVPPDQAAHPSTNGNYTIAIEALKEARALNRACLDELDAESAKAEAEVRDREEELLRVRMERNAAFEALDFTPCDLCQADGTPLLCDRCWVRFLDMTSALVRLRFSHSRNRRRSE